MNDINQVRIEVRNEDIDNLICEWDRDSGNGLFRVYANKGTYFWYNWHEWMEGKARYASVSLIRFTKALRRVIDQGRIDWAYEVRGTTRRYMKRKTGKMITQRGNAIWFVDNEQLDTDEVEAWLTEMGWTDLDAPDKLVLFKLRWSPA